jgi:tetratricopeptide (TPR) repeat protein
LQCNFFAQQNKVDSLLNVAKTAKQDSTRINALNNLSEATWKKGEYSKAKEYAVQALDLANMNALATKGDDRNYLIGKANAYNQIAIVYRYLGNYPEALKNHFAALKIREQTGDKKGLARSYLGLGSIYNFMGDNTKALDYNFRSKKIYEDLGDQDAIANVSTHIGMVYYDMGDYDKAGKFQNDAVMIYTKIGNFGGMIVAYNYFGLIFEKKGDYPDAISNFNMCLTVSSALGSDRAIEANYFLGDVYIKMKKYDSASIYLKDGLALAKKIGSKEHQKDIYRSLTQIDSIKKDYASAFEHYKSFILFRDSLVNQRSSEKISEMQMEYENDKKEQVRALQEEQKEIKHKAAEKQQRTILYAVSGSFFLMLILAFVIYRGYRQKQKANNELQQKNILIEEQKALVEEKNKDILDSIHYARRIQQSLLPTEKYIMRKLEHLKKLMPIFLILISSSFAKSQESKLDSLGTVLKNSKEDSAKVNVLNLISWELKYSNIDSSIILSTQALHLSEELKMSGVGGSVITGWQKGVGQSNQPLGTFYEFKSNYSTALAYYSKALSVWDKLILDPGAESLITIKKKKLSTLGGIGTVYYDESDNTLSLKFQFEALKIADEIKDKKRESALLGNIGNVFYSEGEFDKALNYEFRALKIAKEINDKDGILIHLGNIGNIYQDKKDYPNALDSYNKAMVLAKKTGNQKGLAVIIGNIGNLYNFMGRYDKALENYFQALKIAYEQVDQNAIARHTGNIGSLYITLKNYKLAEHFISRSTKIADSIGSMDIVRNNEKNASEVYAELGQFKESLIHYKKYIFCRDSIMNEENTKKQTQTEMQYEFDKKTVADSIKNFEQVKQEEIKHNQEIQQQKTYTYGGLIGFLLMIVVAIVSFRAYRQKQKANEIIFHQKLLVEEKQKEVLDSIHYARRIQRSLLPTEKYIDKNLNRLKNK